MAKKKKAKRQTLPLHVNTAGGKTVNMRQAILDRLEELRQTRNWLAAKSGLRVATVYEYLADEQDVWSEKVELMMAALDLEVRPKQ